MKYTAVDIAMGFPVREEDMIKDKYVGKEPVVTTDSQARKNAPIMRGCLDYFPDALLAVAELSLHGNDKHNPGQSLHWSKEKSSDHADCCVRHLLDRGTMDYSYGKDKPVRHSTAAAWRALANLQIEIEESRKAEKERQ